MMPDSLVYNTLAAEEISLVNSIRQFMFQEERDRYSTRNHAVHSAIDAPIRRLLGLLWEYDPFVVDLYGPGDPSVSVFELQLLYAIAARRAGHLTIVSEILAWWLPQRALTGAKRELSTIACMLDQVGMAAQSIERLKAHILALTSTRRRNHRLFIVNSRSSTAGCRVVH